MGEKKRGHHGAPQKKILGLGKGKRKKIKGRGVRYRRVLRKGGGKVLPVLKE